MHGLPTKMVWRNKKMASELFELETKKAMKDFADRSRALMVGLDGSSNFEKCKEISLGLINQMMDFDDQSGEYGLFKSHIDVIRDGIKSSDNYRTLRNQLKFLTDEIDASIDLSEEYKKFKEHLEEIDATTRTILAPPVEEAMSKGEHGEIVEAEESSHFQFDAEKEIMQMFESISEMVDAAAAPSQIKKDFKCKLNEIEGMVHNVFNSN